MGRNTSGKTTTIESIIIINYKRNRLEFSIDNREASMGILLKLIDNLDKLEKHEDR